MSHSQTFDDRLNSYILPPPGPQYYAARRAIWLLPIPEQAELKSKSPLLPSLQKLEKALDTPGAVNDDQLWRNSLQSIWNGLSTGGVLKRSIPMNLLVKIIHAAWLRDSTWPAGAEAPEPDDVLAAGEDNIGQLAPPLILKSSLGQGSKPGIAGSLECEERLLRTSGVLSQLLY